MSLLNWSLHLSPIKHNMLRERCVCMTKFPPRDYTEPQAGAINTVGKRFFSHQPDERWSSYWELALLVPSVLEILMVKGIAKGSLCSALWDQRFSLWSCLLLSLCTALLRLQFCCGFSHWHCSRVPVISRTEGSQDNDRTRKIAINSEYSLSPA